MKINFLEKFNKTPDSLHLEHLKQGFKPIITCIVDKNNQESSLDVFNNIKNSGANIDYLKDSSGYNLSNIDNVNKYSEDYSTCTGIVAVGIDKNTKERISFLTHHNPILFDNKETSSVNEHKKFQDNLDFLLKDFHERTEDGSVDILLFGGSSSSNFSSDSIKYLNNVIKKEFKFKPTIVTDTNSVGDIISVFLDTKNSRFYFLTNEKKQENLIPRTL